MIQEDFYRSVSLSGAVLALAAAGISFLCGQWSFGAAVLVSVAWVFLNGYFLFRLFQMGFESKTRTSDKILLFSVLKFPVLYVAGYFILKSRAFPVYGILTGLTLYVIAFLVSWARVSFKSEPRVGGMNS